MAEQSVPVPFQPSQWARWQWSDGLGRWHAIAGTVEGVTRLACGRTRKPPAVTAERPSNDKCCPTCRTLDDLRLSLGGKEDTSEPSVTFVPSEPVTVGAGPAASNG